MLFAVTNKMNKHHKSRSHASTSGRSHHKRHNKTCDQLDDDHYHYRSTSNPKPTTSRGHKKEHRPSKEQLKQRTHRQSHSHTNYDHEGQKNTPQHHTVAIAKPASISATPRDPHLKPTPNPDIGPLRSTSHSISKDEEKEISLPLTSPHTNDGNGNPSINIKFDAKTECEKNHRMLTLIAMHDNMTKQNKIDALIKFITTTNTRQRIAIIKYLRTQYNGFDLEDYIEKNFKGMFKRILLYSVQTQLQRNLYSVSIGAKKMKDINGIISILTQYDGASIKQMMALYKPGMFEKSLEQQIIKLTSDNSILRSFVIGLLNGNRSQRMNHINDLIEEDTLFLGRLLNQQQWDSMDAAKFVDIFTRRSFDYIKLLSESFKKLATISLIDAFKGALGDKEDIGYAVNCILLFVTDKDGFYRKLLKKGMIYGGHKHILFWRVIIDRMDMDLMEILNGYGRYEGGKSDVDKYNLTHFVKVKLCKDDENASKLLMKICNF